MLDHDTKLLVTHAIAEDVGSGDLSAALIGDDVQVKAEVICRQNAVICGISWFDEVFHQIDPHLRITWQVTDSMPVQPNQLLCTLQGKAKSILTGERTALNFLQMLSATATATHEYVQLVAGTSTKILDTRKTIPSMRKAQKYAVRCGGGHNHRMGLYDAILIKENHIAACGSITNAVTEALQSAPNALIEIEVENLAQLREALAAGVVRILLDNFSIDNIRAAVKITQGHAELEVSGNITHENVRAIAETGVNYISIGALTKHIHAVDLSLRVV